MIRCIHMGATMFTGFEIVWRQPETFRSYAFSDFSEMKRRWARPIVRVLIEVMTQINGLDDIAADCFEQNKRQEIFSQHCRPFDRLVRGRMDLVLYITSKPPLMLSRSIGAKCLVAPVKFKVQDTSSIEMYKIVCQVWLLKVIRLTCEIQLCYR